MFIDAPPFHAETTPGSDDKIYLFGKFGLRLAEEGRNWFGFGMFPKQDADLLRLTISPKTSNQNIQ